MKPCAYCGRDNADEALNCCECGTAFGSHAAKAAPGTGAEGDLPPEKKSLVLRIFSDRQLAELAVAKLKAHGVEAWVETDDCAGMYPNLTVAEGVRLKVWAEDQAIATAVLDAKPSAEESGKIEIEAVLATPPRPAPQAKLAWGKLLTAFLLGVLVSLLYQWRQEQTPVTHYDYTADGKRADAWIYKGGHLVEHMEDRNLDGQWDSWTYYEHGRAVRTEYDNNFDGKPDEFWTLRPDGVDTLEKDSDFNGVPDIFFTYKYHILQQVEVRPNGSKYATQRELYTNGIMTESWLDGDSNGNFREVVKYDPFFNPISTNVPVGMKSEDRYRH